MTEIYPYLLLKSKLQDAYRTFRIFHGEMDNIVNTNGIESLRATMDLFLENYWKNASFNNWNIFDILGGVHYLPILPNDFLSIQSFINQVVSKFSSFKSKAKIPNSSSRDEVIRGCLFIFDSYLVYNGISQEESRIISQYLSNIIDERVKYNSQNANTTSGIFITGPEDIQSSVTRFSAPKVFINGDLTEGSNVIIYKVRIFHNTSTKY